MSLSISFNGKTAIVTGASSGIGRRAALEYAKRGAAVAAVDIEDARQTVKTIEEAGGTAAFFRCDIADEEQVAKMVRDVTERFGRLDIAFNCAGVGPDGVRFPYTLLTETAAEDWKKIIDINLTGTFFCLKHELLQMRKQGFGAIVNTSSTGGDRFAPGFNAYGPSKAGVIALTEMASNENARSGIRVNAVCPGPTYGTQMMNNTISADAKMEKLVTEQIVPMGKFGRMEDVVEAVLWLSSELAGHTTGQSLFVDGGMHVKP
jgi:NAD(P)-dependent dehydrogenase (short-subunit alcohol dehydrogenase family)